MIAHPFPTETRSIHANSFTHKLFLLSLPLEQVYTIEEVPPAEYWATLDRKAEVILLLKDDSLSQALLTRNSRELKAGIGYNRMISTVTNVATHNASTVEFLTDWHGR